MVLVFVLDALLVVMSILGFGCSFGESWSFWYSLWTLCPLWVFFRWILAICGSWGGVGSGRVERGRVVKRLGRFKVKLRIAYCQVSDA